MAESSLQTDFTPISPSAIELESGLTPQTPPATFSDIFSDSPTTSRPSSPSSGLPPDLVRLRAIHNTEGYRAGISAAKPEHIQAGFDEGYQLGARIGLKIGWVLGVLVGLKRVFPEDTELERYRKRAEQELVLVEVFGRKWWDEMGTWKWEVPGEKEGVREVEVTLDDVVEAFPVWKEWKALVDLWMNGKGLKAEELV